MNASGRSPYDLTYDYFKKNGITRIPATGPLPVSVPGCVDGWFELHKKFGKLPVADILKPAISLCQGGVPGNGGDCLLLELQFKEPAKVPWFQGNLYAKRPKRRLKVKSLKTLTWPPRSKKLLREDAMPFTKGKLPKKMVDYMKEQGGFLSMRDLADHHSEWVEPISTNYRGYDIWELPPNGQGTAVLQQLNMLEKFDVAKDGFRKCGIHPHLRGNQKTGL